MMCSVRTLSRALFACLCFFTFTSGLRAQAKGAQIPGPWPSWTPVCPCITSYDALQILYNYGVGSCSIPDAALRLSVGGSCNTQVFGQLGIADTLHKLSSVYRPAEWFSAFAPMDATVLRSSEGDLILSATTFAETPTHGPEALTASIRFGTTPDTLSDTADHPADIERMVIMGNGNVGIDLPPSPWSSLDSAADQVQIGGGMIPPMGYPTAIPGLTIYGGNRFEGMPKLGGGTYGVDTRYISFNHYQNHFDESGGRFAPMGGSGVFFGEGSGGDISLVTAPWWPGDSLSDWSGGETLRLDGQGGLSFWSDERRFGGYEYNDLLTIQRPDTTGDSLGMTFIHTPTYIGTIYRNSFYPPWPGFGSYSVQPAMGGTWMLAVDGPALFKEAYVNPDWADFVFDPRYKLMPLAEVQNYITRNHHLPDVPSADSLAKTGVPLGQTEAKTMQKVEELTLYIIQQQKEIDALKQEVSNLIRKGK